MFYCKKVTNDIAHIQRGRDKIGSIMRSKQQVGMFVATVDGEKIYGISISEAFEKMVARLNRISICGVDDAEIARDTVKKQNEEVAKRANELNKELNDLGLPSIYRVKRNKVRI